MSTLVRSTRGKLASVAVLGAAFSTLALGVGAGGALSGGEAAAVAPHAVPASLLSGVQDRTGHHLKSEASMNWAGPVITGSHYVGVTTTFVVPAAKCTPDHKFMIASFWAGLDGAADTSPTVEQAGVDVDCYQGTGFYQAWTEQYPQPSATIDSAKFSFVPGDTLRVSVAAGANSDVYRLDDLTTGARFSTTVASPAGAEEASAECIAEAPTGPHGLELLADFGSASFGGCEATLAGTAPVAHCELVSGAGCPKGSDVTIDHIQGRVLRFIPIHKASVASAGGGAFTVTWRHS